MRKVLIACLVLFSGFLDSQLLLTPPEAQARPKYLGVFIGKYPGVANQAKMVKCGVCHGESKKSRNEYGNAVGAGLPAKNVKDANMIDEALDGAATMKPTGSAITFGEIIASGQLPN